MTTETTETEPQAAHELIDAPEDADESVATGYMVYDRTVGQYVGSKLDSKPSSSDVRKAVRKGHTGAAVRV